MTQDSSLDTLIIKKNDQGKTFYFWERIQYCTHASFWGHQPERTNDAESMPRQRSMLSVI